MLPGAASIYYGDEAEIDGFTDSMEGCRYPMPWDKDYRSSQQYRVNHTMANLKAKHPALSKGSVKFLYAEGQILSLARFWEQEAFVCVISTEEEDKFIRLPLGAVGAAKPEDVEDVFGCPLVLEDCDSHSVIMLVKAHQSYLFRCNIP
jgi:alpha-glucosidase